MPDAQNNRPRTGKPMPATSGVAPVATSGVAPVTTSGVAPVKTGRSARQAVLPGMPVSLCSPLNAVQDAFKALNAVQDAFKTLNVVSDFPSLCSGGVADLLAMQPRPVGQKLQTTHTLLKTMDVLRNSAIVDTLHPVPLRTIACVSRFTELSDSLTQIQKQLQTFVPISVAALSDTELRIQSEMKAMLREANSSVNLSQCATVIAHLKASDIASLAGTLFTPEAADYFSDAPFTETEWHEAAQLVAEETPADTTQFLAEMHQAVQTPDAHRLHFARYLLLILLLLCSTGGLTLATLAQKSVAIFLGYLVSTCCSTLLGPCISAVLRDWRAAHASVPVAQVVGPAGGMIPIRCAGHPRSRITHRLAVGELVALAHDGTRDMKAVVIDIDRDGNPIETGWIERRFIRRVKPKTAYALKKQLAPGASQHD